MAEEKDSGILTIVLIVLGAAVIFQIFKSSSQTKQMQQQVQQLQQQQAQQNLVSSSNINSIYENDEKWQIERGDNGHIIDLRVVRNARVSDGTNSNMLSTSGLPSLHIPDAIMPERVIKPVEPGRIQQNRIAEMARITRMNESYRREHFGMV